MRVDPNLSSLLNIGIQSTEQALNTAVQQLASGQRVSVPSDDPAAAATNLQSLAESANVDRYTKNGDAVLSQAQMADSALSNVVNELNQAITLGTQGADGSMTSENRAAIATQVQSVLSRSRLASKYDVQWCQSVRWYVGCCAGICVRQHLTDRIYRIRETVA